MKKNFRKSDLRSGMIVENEKGEKGIVFLNTSETDVIGGCGGVVNRMWCPLASVNDDLSLHYRDNARIVKVYEPTGNIDIGGFVGRLIWEREEEKPICTIDGVDYTESTLRSIIKKATQG